MIIMMGTLNHPDGVKHGFSVLNQTKSRRSPLLYSTGYYRLSARSRSFTWEPRCPWGHSVLWLCCSWVPAVPHTFSDCDNVTRLYPLSQHRSPLCLCEILCYFLYIFFPVRDFFIYFCQTFLNKNKHKVVTFCFSSFGSSHSSSLWVKHSSLQDGACFSFSPLSHFLSCVSSRRRLFVGREGRSGGWRNITIN